MTRTAVDRTRRQAIDAAWELLLEEGWSAVTHGRVASRSGLARATIYRHWPEPADLLRDTLARSIPFTAVETTPDLGADIAAILRSMVQMLTDGGFGAVLGALVDRAEQDPAFARLRQRLVREGTDGLRDRLSSAVERGEMEPVGDIDALVTQLVAPIVYRRVISGEPVGPGFIEHIVERALPTPTHNGGPAL